MKINEHQETEKRERYVCVYKVEDLNMYKLIIRKKWQLRFDYKKKAGFWLIGGREEVMLAIC